MKLRGTSFYLTVLIGFVGLVLLVILLGVEPASKVKEAKQNRNDALAEAMEALDEVQGNDTIEDSEELEIIDDEALPAASPFE